MEDNHRNSRQSLSRMQSRHSKSKKPNFFLWIIGIIIVAVLVMFLWTKLSGSNKKAINVASSESSSEIMSSSSQSQISESSIDSSSEVSSSSVSSQEVQSSSIASSEAATSQSSVQQSVANENNTVTQQQQSNTTNQAQSTEQQPVQQQQQTYTVKNGDSLYLIAKKQGVSVEQIVKLNNLTMDAVLQPGMNLKIN